MRRFDETWHLLLEWTMGQTPSERMAALILDEEGFESIDPAHPLGGRDGGADAFVQRSGEPWVMAVYFPRGQQNIRDITEKLTSDVEKAKTQEPKPVGVAFVTNQELRLAEREDLGKLGGDTKVELFHLERVTTVLDRPHMAGVREQFLGIPAGPPPILVAAEVVGHARSVVRGDELLDTVVEIEEKALRERNEELRTSPPDPLAAWQPVSMRSLGYQAADEPDQPMSEEQIIEEVATLRRDLVRRWAACQDYLASTSWPALRFRITNQAQSFLTNVQVILTFHGAGGVEFADIETFEWERLKDPDWEPPAYGPFGISPIQNFIPALPADYPVEWEDDDDGNLEVTITLAELRPHPPWRHNADDVVLMLRAADLDEVIVTYTVTAHEHGTVFVGEPFTLRVEQVDILDAAQAAIEGSDKN